MARVRYRITIVATISYVLFCCAAPVSILIPKALIGELSDTLATSAILWPYPLLLSLQKFINPDSLSSLVIVDAVGLGLVIFWGRIIDRIYVPMEQSSNQGTAHSDEEREQNVPPAPANPPGNDTLRKWCEWAGVIFYGILSWIVLFVLLRFSLGMLASVAGWSVGHR